jgi:hypothetical protein
MSNPKDKYTGWNEPAPSYRYWSFEDDGDEFEFRFLKNTNDWDGKPCALVQDPDNDKKYFVGGQGILERLLNAKEGDIFLVQAGEKSETGAGRTFRNYTVRTPPDQKFVVATREQIEDLRKRLDAKSF